MAMRPAIRLLPASILVVFAASCSKPDNNAPASQQAVADAPSADLPEAAQSALAKGNDEYRAGRFEEALAQYTIATREAPAHAAPYYGVLMAAQKLGNRNLADSASAMIKQLSGEDGSVHVDPNANPHAPGRKEGVSRHGVIPPPSGEKYP